MEEREALVQDLQDTITELHQEITRKDQDQLSQLLHIQRLQSSVEQLTEQVPPLPQRDSQIGRASCRERVSSPV